MAGMNSGKTSSKSEGRPGSSFVATEMCATVLCIPNKMMPHSNRMSIGLHRAGR